MQQRGFTLLAEWFRSGAELASSELSFLNTATKVLNTASIAVFLPAQSVEFIISLPRYSAEVFGS